MLAGLLLTPVLSRSLDLGQYGRLSISISTMQVLVALLTLGIPLVITRHALVEPSGLAGARSIALAGMGMACAAGALLAGAGYAVSRLMSGHVDWSLFLAAPAGALGAGIAIAQAIAVAVDHAWRYVHLAFAVSLFAPSLGLLGVAVTRPTATSYFVFLCLAYALALSAAAGEISRSERVAMKRSDFMRTLRMGLPLVPHQLALGSGTIVAVLAAGAWLGVRASGQAQIAVYLASVPIILVSAVSYAWLPATLQTHVSDRGRQLTDTARTIAWLAALCGSGVALLSPWGLRFLAPPRYDVVAMVPVTSMVAASAGLAALFTAYMQLVIISGRTGLLAIGTPLAFAVGGVSGGLLTGAWGLTGVGVGYLVTYVLLCAVVSRLGAKHAPVGWSARPTLLPILVGAISCVSSATILPQAGTGATIVRWGLAAVAALLCTAIVARVVRSAHR